MPENEIEVQSISLEETMQYHGTDLLHYKIKYPRLRSRRFRSAVNRINYYYKTKALQFRKRCKKQIYPEAIRNFEALPEEDRDGRLADALLTYQVTNHQNETFSLYYDEYTYRGGAHGNTIRSSDTWNLKRVDRIHLRQLFRYYVRYKEYIVRLIIKNLEQQMQKEPFDNVRKNFREDQFSLDHGGIVIYYQKYQIAPYLSGVPEFQISYARGKATPPAC